VSLQYSCNESNETRESADIPAMRAGGSAGAAGRDGPLGLRAGLDEGVLPFSLPFLVHMENNYRWTHT
jgi:hypothetical protein